jgi:hypothetical protein
MRDLHGVIFAGNNDGFTNAALKHKGMLFDKLHIIPLRSGLR